MRRKGGWQEEVWINPNQTWAGQREQEAEGGQRGNEGGNRGSWGWEREGIPELSNSLPVLVEHSNSLLLQPRPPPVTPHHYHTWGGGPREPGPLASSATTAVEGAKEMGKGRTWSQWMQGGAKRKGKAGEVRGIKSNLGGASGSHQAGAGAEDRLVEACSQCMAPTMPRSSGPCQALFCPPFHSEASCQG